MRQHTIEMRSSVQPVVRPIGRKRKLGRVFQSRWFYLMMAPGLLYYLLFHYVPMAGILIAFQDYNLMKGVWGSPWVGFDNFRTIFESPDFPLIIRNTLIISLYRILFGLFPDVVLALILNEIRVKWFKKLVQTITYGPFFLSWIIVYGITFSFLAPGSGLLTNLFRDWGWGDMNILTDSHYFRPLLIVTELWKNTGFGAIIYLAALATINNELYEAAVVDGASRWRQMWHVTLPGIRSVFILLLILRVGGILDAGFDQIYIFLNARVVNVGDIIDTWVFRRGLESLDFSVAAATGVFKSIIGFILIVGTNRISKKVEGTSIW